MEGAELCGASGMDTRVGMGMNRYMVSIASEASGVEGMEGVQGVSGSRLHLRHGMGGNGM